MKITAYSLLAHLYPYIKGSQEDVATYSLQYILSQSDKLNTTFTKMVADTMNIGRYFVVTERCESKDFIIGDTYPVVVSGTLPNGVPLETYSFFPLSPERILMMVCRGAEGTPREVLGFRQTVLTMPKMNDDGTYTILSYSK